ncbi:MAG: glycosyltransferase family 9 protein [Flavobacteriales bacterium]|nr:glycosyltransferase family 9 protein [Flavobacteriales bacterium]
MARKISNLILLDGLFSPIYRICSWIVPWFFNQKDSNDKVIAIKFFGMGSIVRLASTLKNTDLPLSNIELITLSKDKKICELLGIKAHCVRSENLFYMLLDLITTVFRVWKMKGIKIIDLERISNFSGTFRLICSIGKSCSSFTFEKENRSKKNQKFISLENKPAIQAIAEIFELNKQTVSQPETIREGEKIVINVNAGEYLPQRKYPIEYVAEIIQQLQQRDSAFEFLLTGLQKELAYTNQLAKMLDELGVSYENTAGKLSLEGLIHVLKNCQMLITNDSGPLHLAHYFNVPTVAIWGPTSAKLVGYSDSYRMVNISTKMECSPCFIHPKSKVARACSNRIDCLHGLDKNRVVEAAFMLSRSLKLASNAE